MLAEAILIHGDIGYEFFLLLPSEDQNQGTPIGNEQLRVVDDMIESRSCELKPLDAMNC